MLNYNIMRERERERERERIDSEGEAKKFGDQHVKQQKCEFEI